MKLIKLYLRFSTTLRNHHHHHHHHLRSLHHLSSTLNSTSQPLSSSFHPPSTSPPRSQTLLLNHNHFPKRFFSKTSSKPDTKNCWNCGSRPTSELFLVCDSCRCVQPIDPSIDYFQIFGLERKYDIAESNLETKYKNWQKKLHPDLVHSKSESEREYAAEQSSRVIDAYRTLSNAMSRAVYLMKLKGVHVDEEQTVSDPDLLAEIMELREAVEDAADSQALKQIQSQVQEKIRQWTESFARAFDSQDTDGALDSIRRMSYYKRANEEIVKRL